MVTHATAARAFEVLARFVDDNNAEHNELAAVRDELLTELRPPTDPFVCNVCGSEAILESVYVSANTGEITSDFDPGTDPICPNCHEAERGLGGGMSRRSEYESE